MTQVVELRTIFDTRDFIVIEKFLPALTLDALLGIAAHAPWHHLPECDGPVRQLKDEANIDIGDGTIRDVAGRVSQIGAELGLDGWAPNECVMNRYESGSGHISLHRDHARYQGMVAILSILGEADFAIAESREGPLLQSWLASPGDLVLLRGGPATDRTDAEVDRRPFHGVGTPRTTQRLSLSLRSVRV